MEIIEVFKNQPTTYNNKVVTFQFDKMNEYGPGTEFRKKVDTFFIDAKKNNALDSVEQYGGDAITSVTMGRQPQWFLNRIGLQNTELLTWLREGFYKGAVALGVPYKEGVDKYTFYRAWANRMFENASGAAHVHGHTCHVTGIFYYEIPENSGDLIFINSDIGREKPLVEKLPPEKIDRIKPKEGMLLIHDAMIPHAVSAHKSDLPRTCFVFDLIFPGVPLNRYVNSKTK